ncbi:MAG: LysR family transcriptional regulator [Pseudomonadota bacterium]
MDAVIGKIHEVDIRRLRIFMTIVERGGFVPAQNELGISASTMSIRMSELEESLGLRLCQRGRAGFSITPEGNAVYRACEDLMLAHESFVSSIGSVKNEISGELRLGVIDNAIFDPDLPISQVIDQFHQQANNLEISLYTLPPTELERALLEQRLHLGIGVFYQRIPRLEYQTLCHEQLLLYCAHSHPLFNQKITNPGFELIQQCEFIERTYGETTSQLNRAIDFKASAWASSLEATAMLILSGKYIGFLPKYYAQLWIDQGLMMALHADEIFIESEISCVTHKTPQNLQMTSRLLEVVKKSMR